MQRLENTLRKELKISNVVCTADLHQKIDLKKLHNFPWGIYDLAIYGGRCGYIKFPNMNGKVTIFSSGKMISIGANSIEKSIHLLHSAKFYLMEAKLISDITIKPLVRNMVSNGNLMKKINIENLAKILPRSMYEPEQFAGLIYRIFGSVVVLIFASGKVVIVGAKTVDELNRALFELKQKIE